MYFEELVERAHYYERVNLVNKAEKMQSVFRKDSEARIEKTIIEC